MDINARKVNTGVERQQYKELGPQMNADYNLMYFFAPLREKSFRFTILSNEVFASPARTRFAPDRACRRLALVEFPVQSRHGRLCSGRLTGLH